MFNNIYLINSEISDKVNKLINNYEVDEGEFKEGTIDLEDLIHLDMLKKLTANIKNKVITPVCYYQVLVGESVNESTLSFHAEHALMRITSVWEHLFQILNTYLEINDTPRRVKEGVEEWEILKQSTLHNKNNKFKKYASVSNEVLSGKNFVKKIKKKYTSDSYLRKLVNISNKTHWKKIREHRNDIIHHKFIGQSAFVISASKEHYSIRFDNNAEKDFNYRELATLFSVALKEIKEALELTFLMFKKDLIPNKKSSSREEHFLLKIQCSCEEHIKLVPDLFLDLDNKLMKKGSLYRGLFCPNCFSEEISILEERHKVSQRKWDLLLNDYYYNKVPLYVEKKLKE
ncbi:hypothetical protein [Lysinibacillus sp. FSL M8-0134]|uniref:hypothetical protein n=1 Tax=Lysinibacillus sp. FSL M8-0134 TaxID=2921717 RepID=UPI003119645C